MSLDKVVDTLDLWGGMLTFLEEGCSASMFLSAHNDVVSCEVVSSNSEPVGVTFYSGINTFMDELAYHLLAADGKNYFIKMTDMEGGKIEDDCEVHMANGGVVLVTVGNYLNPIEAH